MGSKENMRQSNFELMRIVSMFMIVFWHFFRNGTIIYGATGTTKYLLIIIQCLFEIHVNSFILLTGYFQCEKKFKMGKVIQINNSMWFYKALIPLILSLIGYVSIKKVEMLKLLSPISHRDYWFISLYLILYLISPILNVAIQNINKEKHRNIILILIFTISILPTITDQTFFDNNYGYSLTNFILLYFIGAYLKKYGLFKKDVNDSKKRLICILLYIFIAYVCSVTQISTTVFENNGELSNYIANILNKSFTSYDNPLVILQSICYFGFFSTLKFNSKLINKISKTCMGIYLIHDNGYIITLMFDMFGLNNCSYNHLLIKLFLLSIAVYIVCTIIESIRLKVFKFIYNRKISFNFREKWKRNFESLGWNINW